MSDERLNEELKKEEEQNPKDENLKEINEEKIDEDYEKLRDAFQRLQADFANYKRRQEKEKQDIYKYASESLITKLLSVLDNFDRALEGADNEDAFVQGVILIKNELNNILENEGLEEIKSNNEPFDANLHHAVFMEENGEIPSEHIIETFQKGYKLKDKVIRPAMVKVSK